MNTSISRQETPFEVPIIPLIHSTNTTRRVTETVKTIENHPCRYFLSSLLFSSPNFFSFLLFYLVFFSFFTTPLLFSTFSSPLLSYLSRKSELSSQRNCVHRWGPHWYSSDTILYHIISYNILQWGESKKTRRVIVTIILIIIIKIEMIKNWLFSDILILLFCWLIRLLFHHD